MDMMTVYLIAALAPLAGAIVAGFFGRAIGRAGAHSVTIGGVAISAIASAVVFHDVWQGNLLQMHRLQRFTHLPTRWVGTTTSPTV